MGNLREQPIPTTEYGHDGDNSMTRTTMRIILTMTFPGNSVHSVCNCFFCQVSRAADELQPAACLLF